MIIKKKKGKENMCNLKKIVTTFRTILKIYFELIETRSCKLTFKKKKKKVPRYRREFSILSATIGNV